MFSFAPNARMSQTEINTHLNVLHIDLNSNYESATSSGGALQIMRSKFARSGGWHFASPSGVQPDLHHALLSRNLGGGIAYLGVLCNPTYGFGLSGSLSGNYRGMGNALVWDMMVVSSIPDGCVRARSRTVENMPISLMQLIVTIRVCPHACPPPLFKFMHEIGHNFNSGHTHDGGYSPRVDTCGCPYSNGHCADSCPSQLPLPKSATLMSYCHLCSGGYSNVDYTFGGKYSGTGPRGDINSYSNSPLAGSVSNNPRQVNVKMWGHVSSRGTCTEPYPIGVVSYFAPTPSYLFVPHACSSPSSHAIVAPPNDVRRRRRPRRSPPRSPPRRSPRRSPLPLQRDRSVRPARPLQLRRP